MSPSVLKSLLPELQNKKFVKMTDDELYSYVRIYYSLYRLVRDNALETQYGEASLYTHKLNIICRMLVRRYHADETLSRRCAILDTLYTLHYATGITHGITTEDKYFNEAQTLISKYLETAETVDDNTRYHALRLIMSTYYGCTLTDTPSQKHLQQQLQSWSIELREDGKWQDISLREALHRIHLYSTNVAFNNDDSYTETLRKTSSYYIKAINTADYDILYDVTRDNTITSVDPQPVLDAITQTLPNNYKATAIKIENTCRQIAREVQETLFK